VVRVRARAGTRVGPTHVTTFAATMQQWYAPTHDVTASMPRG
jgi:hypothetical protein